MCIDKLGRATLSTTKVIIEKIGSDNFPNDQAPNLWQILSTSHSMLHVLESGNPEHGMWILPHSRFPIQIHEAESRFFRGGVLSNRHKFWAKPQTYDGYSALYTRDSHSTLRIPPFKYIVCWVWSAEYPS